MPPNHLLPALFCVLFLPAAWGQNEAYQTYIDRYGILAVMEMERTGIPASIKMAQAILESNAGRSDLARHANNHFGIKCGSRWSGKGYKKKDDDRHRGRLVKSCFRRYQEAEDSFIDHSEFLTGNARYSDLFKLRPDDYKGWARGLKRAGYATSSSYHRKLIALIEAYDLQKLDHRSSDELLAKGKRKGKSALPASSGLEETSRNDVRCLIADSPMSVSAIASLADVRLRKILRHNENISGPHELIPAGQPVYLQPKRKSFRGKSKWHTVEGGESLLDVAVAYGIDLDKLSRRNRLEPDQLPAGGQRIKLRGGKVKERPALAVRQREEALAEAAPDRPKEQLDFVISRPQEERGSAPARERAATKGEAAPPAYPPPSVGTDPFAPAGTPDGVERSSATERPDALFHEVARGDTLWSIARRHQLTVAELKTLNNLKEDTIRRGMKLRVR